jgi:mono/diheme cytochrome c family protein
VGGDDGPDLTRVGERDPGQLDFTHVEGEHTLAGWLAEHFRAPGRVVRGSTMPELGLAAGDVEALTFYMLSLRRSDFPEAYWPDDRIRAERFGEREFSTDGATLYGTFCAACHGARGEGMRYPGMSAFPAIGNPDFLALAPDSFLTATVRHGRPGRRMPAWAETEGGLRPAEIDTLVAFVRALGGVEAEPDPRPRRWVRGDPELGGRLYAGSCAACHGARGEGGEGPALRSPVLLASATDTYLVETIRRGRRGTAMAGFAAPSPARRELAPPEIEAIVSAIRTWEVKR